MVVVVFNADYYINMEKVAKKVLVIEDDPGLLKALIVKSHHSVSEIIERVKKYLG